LLVLLPVPAPQPANPISRHNATNVSTSQPPRRLLMSSIPIIENGSSARKIDLAPLTFAEVPLPPVVFTETVTDWVVLPSMVSGFGEIEQLVPFGPEQVKSIEPLYPFNGETLNVYVAVPPSVIETPVDCGVTSTGGALAGAVVPVPLSATIGEFEPLPETVNVAVSSAALLGVNFTLIVQVALAASVAPCVGQVVAGEPKSAPFVPEIAMLLMASAEVDELFVSVTV
jgi:hypothetical protein